MTASKQNFFHLRNDSGGSSDSPRGASPNLRKFTLGTACFLRWQSWRADGGPDAPWGSAGSRWNSGALSPHFHSEGSRAHELLRGGACPALGSPKSHSLSIELHKLRGKSPGIYFLLTGTQVGGFGPHASSHRWVKCLILFSCVCGCTAALSRGTDPRYCTLWGTVRSSGARAPISPPSWSSHSCPSPWLLELDRYRANVLLAIYAHLGLLDC